MNIVNKIAIATSVLCAASFASAVDFEVSYGLGLSDTPIAEYSYTDGSTSTLTAGDGLGVMVKQKITTIGQANIVAGIGYQWGNIFDDSTAISISNSFTYFPTQLNISYAVSPAIDVSGGVSYLLMSSQSVSLNSSKAKLKATSNIGYNLGARYNLESATNMKMYFFAKYAANTASYTSLVDANGNETDVTGDYIDEIVHSIQIGLGLSF